MDEHLLNAGENRIKNFSLFVDDGDVGGGGFGTIL